MGIVPDEAARGIGGAHIAAKHMAAAICLPALQLLSMWTGARPMGWDACLLSLLDCLEFFDF